MLALLLRPPLIWLVVVYLGSLRHAAGCNSFFSLDDFTGQVVREFTLETYAELLQPANLDIFIAHRGHGRAVTLACVLMPSRWRITWRAMPRRASKTCCTWR